MNIITNSVETDERLARLFVGWVVGVVKTSGYAVDMMVTSVQRIDGFVALVGPKFDQDNPDAPGPTPSIALIDIETLEAY